MKKTQQWKTRLVALLLAGGLGFTGAAQAALHDRGGGLIYDDVLDITWLQDANYAQTSDYDPDGKMTWGNSVAWADGLDYGGYEDWRLPMVRPVNGSSLDPLTLSTDGTTDRGTAQTTTGGPDGGWRDASNSPVSEMGHMYYVNLANLGFCDPGLPWCTEQPGWGLNNTSPFSNVQSDSSWSDTESDSTKAWLFFFSDGEQGVGDKGIDHHAWAVRDGDSTFVPVPAAFWLFGSGLVGLVAIARRRRLAA